VLDVPYGDAPSETLDLFRTRAPEAPVFVFIHGGWWRALDKRDYSFVAPALADAGALVVMPNYALCPAVSIDAIALQLTRALAWVWRHARAHGGDPRRIVVGGHSAGGHLALMAGAATPAAFEGTGGNAGVSSAVSAVISFYPPTGLDKREWGGMPTLFGKGAPVETMKSASPLEYATPSFPPTLLMHGNADELVPNSEVTSMYDALHAAGVPVEMHMFANQPHAFDADPKLGRLSAEIMLSFLDRYILQERA